MDIRVCVLILASLLMGDCAHALKRISVSSYNQVATPHISSSANMCTPHIAHIEKKHGIPGQLLTAIAHVESGRWNARSKKREPWPWAIHAEGKGHFFSTKAEALEAVRKLLNRGVTNIDVGCMQINISHHGHAFSSLSHMFDPAQNVAYAGKFLKALRGNASSWLHAAGNYHSATPVHHIAHRKKVYKAWAKLRQGDFGEDDAEAPLGGEDGFESLSIHAPLIINVEAHKPGKGRRSYGLTGARRLVKTIKVGKGQVKVQTAAYRKRSIARPIMIRRGTKLRSR